MYKIDYRGLYEMFNFLRFNKVKNLYTIYNKRRYVNE
jgi:hypothetical protein